MIEQAHYRLAFVFQKSRQLFAFAGPDGPELPVAHISGSERPVHGLTRQIEATWKIQTIVLDLVASQTVEPACALIEVESVSRQFDDAGLFLLDPGDIRNLPLTAAQSQAITATLTGDAMREPLCRIGWIKEAVQWIEGCLAEPGILSGAVHHMNGCGPFALVRFDTLKGPSYWLKATGCPNAHESSITRLLSGIFPEFLPPLIAVREDWNAWVTEDGGEPLNQCLTLDAIERAAASLCRLEIRSIPHTGMLMAEGCIDCTPRMLESRLDELFDFLAEAMQQQTSTSRERLSRNQLTQLRARLRTTCHRMNDLDIPDSLVQGDINPGNILLNGSRCTFIDWAEASVGNPFVNLEQFAHHLDRFGGESGTWGPRLRALYKRHWLDMLSESTIEDAFSLAPVLAIATYLLGRGDWLQSTRRNDAGCQAFARSLARRMYGAAPASGPVEALC